MCQGGESLLRLTYNQIASKNIINSASLATEDDMHILSLSDIQLIIRLFEQRDVLSDTQGREHQIYHLIKMGYLRPLRGIYALTELGERTARSLQMRQFVPSKMAEPEHALTDDSGEAASLTATESSATLTTDSATESAALAE
jgi:hypothetical protein